MVVLSSNTRSSPPPNGHIINGNSSSPPTPVPPNGHVTNGNSSPPPPFQPR